MSLARFALTLCMVMLLAFGGKALAQEPMRLPVDEAPLVFETADGDAAFELEVADDADERSRGLMHRTDMPVNRAMIFVYGGDNRIAMWMANTPRSLDMVFLDAAGQVTAVVSDTEPFSRTVISPEVMSRFVVELNAGVAKARGIVPGTTARHPLIDAAN